MVSVPSSLGMTSGQIALRILRGRDQAEETGLRIGSRNRPTPENRADKALANIMRIVINADRVDIRNGSDPRSGISYGGPGWKLAIEGNAAVGNGSVSVDGASATGLGDVAVSSLRVAAALDGTQVASNLLTSAQARGAVSLEAGGVNVSAAGAGRITAQVDQHTWMSAGDASTYTQVFASGQGDIAMSVMAFPADGRMEVYAGAGNDTISAVAGQSVSVRGEAGNDTIAVTSLSRENDAVGAVDGGDGNDAIAISSRGGVWQTIGGDGNDAIAVAAAGQVDILDGGDGNDSIAISAHSARSISGGGGNDVIKVSAGLIEGISGGKGDDRIVLESTAGKASTVYFGEGDGNDVIETNGPLDIRRVSEDGTRMLDMSSAAVTRNDDGTATIRFEGSNDTLTVRFTGKAAGAAFSLQQDRGRLIIGPAAA